MNEPVGYWRKQRVNVRAAVHQTEVLHAASGDTPQFRRLHVETLVYLGKVEQHFGNKRWVRKLYERMDAIRPAQTFQQGA